MSRQILYPNGDGITKISDPFWRNYCKKCGYAFWSCICTEACPECGNQDLKRELGTVPYEQIIAERGEPIKQKSE
ncbi:MAG: hypothetical protein HFG80_10535 [Eubacterium sp.]|nr:hypothetical protein [Eubacterium sp.]